MSSAPSSSGPRSSGPPASSAAPPPSDDLVKTISSLEDSTWRALKHKGGDLLPYLSSDCTMQFPQGASLSTKSEPSISDVLLAEAYTPWKHYEMKETRVVPVGGEGAVICYRVRAWRGNDEMEALVSTTWRKEGGEWKIVAHQQTPY